MAKIKGLDKTIRALNKEIGKIEGRTTEGLIEAAFLIKNAALKQTPVDKANLRGSAYVVSKNSISAPGTFSGDDAEDFQEDYTSATQDAQIQAEKSDAKGIPVVFIGFAARYAAAVHEAMETVFQSPGTGAKYLENAIKTNVSNIINIIKKKVSR